MKPVPVPVGWRLRLAAGVRLVRGGQVLIGGAPLRILTLSPRGALLVAGWLAGQPVREEETERVLARRLLDAGLADPDPPARPACPARPARPARPACPARPAHPACPARSVPPARATPDEPEVTIVVPVYRDAERLARCLAALAGADAQVTVVDDGSPNGEGIAAVARRFGVRYVRHHANRGSAAARNTGGRADGPGAGGAGATPFVAFLDADCIPPPGFPSRLLDQLADPAVALVAPRIVVSEAARGRIAAYERHRSALDMGPHPSLVRPYSRVWYVPSAAMVARRDALGSGFDEELELGEDVDLVWRLHDAGWQVRYDPSVEVAHEHRASLGAWYRRRVAYNESVAPLLRRHPERLPVMFLSPVAGLAWGAALGGAPLRVALLTAVRAARLRRAVGDRLARAGAWACGAALDMTIREAHDLGRALAGPWAPFALLLGRRRLSLLLAAMLMRDWLDDRPSLDPVSYALLRLADESARGAGIWLGCIRARDFRGLLPRRPPPLDRR